MKVRDLINEVQSIHGDEFLSESMDISRIMGLIKDQSIIEKIKANFKKFGEDYRRILSKKLADNKINADGKKDPEAYLKAEEENDKRGAFMGALAYMGITLDLPKEPYPA